MSSGVGETRSMNSPGAYIGNAAVYEDDLGISSRSELALALALEHREH
jgi:hypothetical protein